MSQILWFVLTWISGTAAILGSLMTLGSFILLVAPTHSRSRGSQQIPSANHFWSQRFILLAFSLALALAGIGILVVMPFPSF